MTIKEKLNLILEKSSLNNDLKNSWKDAFKCLKTQDLITLINILENSSSDEIRELSLNLKRKIEALKNNNADLWKEIINEEKNILSQNV